ncbi:hypothetical protein [Mesorhizobium sp.]|uniref:hypothetical protein n=1 Tax=Mesorhizobium sp. TaxID=1871066 RepID=UPI0025C45D2C|nr:hypothetical protein [Mesorhizobium sp.]
MADEKTPPEPEPEADAPADPPVLMTPSGMMVVGGPQSRQALTPGGFVCMPGDDK